MPSFDYSYVIIIYPISLRQKLVVYILPIYVPIQVEIIYFRSSSIILKSARYSYSAITRCGQFLIIGYKQIPRPAVYLPIFRHFNSSSRSSGAPPETSYLFILHQVLMISIIALKHEFPGVIFIVPIKPYLGFIKRIALAACFDFECKSTFPGSDLNNKFSI